MNSKITVSVLVASFAATLSAGRARAQTPPQGYWDCRRTFGAYTSERQMLGDTKFECLGGWVGGPGICGDDSHTSPGTWVDIAGGISQSCEDHSDSFYGYFEDGDSAPGGPGGEWNGCTIRYGAPYQTSPQVSTGDRWIAGINQGWDRWPDSWWSGHYSVWGCPYGAGSLPMRAPFASVYDLETCMDKEIIGTVYWPDFLVSGNLVEEYDCLGSTGYVKYDLVGDTGLACSTPASYCENAVCADLHVRGTFECFFVSTGCDTYDPYSCS